MFGMENIEINFDKDALRAVAKKAIDLKTGARGLRTILEENMLDLMYEVPSDKNIERITIGEEFITQNKPAKIDRKTEEKQGEEAV